MRLPNPENTVLDMRKLAAYCLDPDYSEGKHKARVFHAALELTLETADELRQALLLAVQTNDATPIKRNPYGQKYQLDFSLTRLNKTATIRSVWIVRDAEDFPRLVTCYVL
jgi:hypothetical protein